jgi:signal transduction histidine kinase/CheY-like chemotaxis protein
MKFNLRLILITFSVTILVSVASIVIIYILTNKILFNQHSSALINTTHHFALTLETNLKKIDNDFDNIKVKDFKLHDDSSSIDFIFTLKDDSLINTESFVSKKKVNLNFQNNSINSFVYNNPNIILKFKEKWGVLYYYGALIDTSYLNSISQVIRADVALIISKDNVISSNINATNNINYILAKAVDKLINKNNYETYFEIMSDYDLMASLYVPKEYSTPYDKAKFVVFSVFKETAEYRSIMQLIIVILISVTIPLSLIFVLIFTSKFRRQLAEINRVVGLTKSDNLNERVNIISKDEIGKLGEVFNGMLNEIKRREETEHEYIRFVTLINENASLFEISEAVLKQIVSSANFDIGVFYVYDGDKFRQTAYAGLNNEAPSNEIIENIYFKVLETKEPVEFIFTENQPILKTSLSTIKLEYIIIYPILFNREIIGILELTAMVKPKINVITYLNGIIEQLSIGLSNAIAYERQKDLVKELQLLNEQYHIQNTKIKEQNEQLIFLHNELKENSVELEKQKQKALESAKLKSQFLATMSHELRTPLNSILGLSELIIKSNNLNAHNDERLKIVINNGKKLLNIINNILTFSKMEADNYELVKDEFLLSEFLRDLYISFAHFAEEKNLTLVIKNGLPGNQLIITDKIKLEQILSNLLSNAIKFTEKGEVSLSVEKQEEKGLRFLVRDTGIGIEEENLELIFKEFRQTSEGSNRKYSGTGLGLTIASRMIELLGGEITVKSKVNIGTVFSVFIPNSLGYESEEGKVIAINEPPIINLPTTRYYKNKIITVLSDNPENTDFLGAYLEQNKFNTEIVTEINSVSSFDKTEAILIDYLSFQNPFIVIDEIVNKINNNIPVILYYYPIGEKSGIIFNANLFIKSPLTFDNFELAIKNIATYYNLEIKNIIAVGKSSFSGISSDYNLKNIKFSSLVSETIVKEKPDCLFVDFLPENIEEIEYVCELLTDRRLLDIPVVLIIPDGNFIDKEILHKINLKIFGYIEKKYIPKNDTLRILRKKLKIGLPENLIIDSSGDFNENDTLSISENPNKKEVVLIVDDDRDTLFTVGQIIESLGYDTLFAKDGLECLLIIENKNPDLVLLDIMMPNMDGFETLKRIKQNIRFSKIPIIALTAHAMMEERDIIIKNGFADLITKPIDITYLSTKVRQILEGSF